MPDDFSADPEAWKRMVLRSMPKPAWLTEPAAEGDVVVSSRTRYMRNLAGTFFVNVLNTEVLRAVQQRVESAVGTDLVPFRMLTNAEREYLVACRLASPEFEWTLPGRLLLANKRQSVSIMVNEEDHLRIQAVTAGWSVDQSLGLAQDQVERLGTKLRFARSADWGYLAASPYNAGLGRRLSAMFHLIGLASEKRLPGMIRALAERGMVARGLFGESSRAVGAFLQVSTLRGSVTDFMTAGRFLIESERESRERLGAGQLLEKAERAKEFVTSSRSVSLADAFRALGYARWAGSAGARGYDPDVRCYDEVLTTLEVRGSMREDRAGQARAEAIRMLYPS